MIRSIMTFLFLTIAFCAMAQRKDFHPNMIAFTTVRIVGLKSDTVINGKTLTKTSTGTGFYYQFKVDTSLVMVIVTNAHVIKGCKKGELTFTEAGEIGLGEKPIFHKITIPDFESKWIIHPDEDLAILPFDIPSDIYFKKYNKQIKTIAFTKETIPTKKDSIQISDVEKVLMVGYPKGIWDSSNNYPIVRQGITATSFYSNFNNQKKFLLDIPSFEGSSGSPIVLYSLEPYFESKEWLKGDFRTYFLGIATESFRYNAEGVLVANKIDELPNRYRIQTEIPVNITVVVKSEKLDEFLPLVRIYFNQNRNNAKSQQDKLTGGKKYLSDSETKNIRIEQVQSEIDKVKQYSYYANLDIYGREITPGYGFKYSSDLSDRMGKVLIVEDGKTYVQNNKSNLPLLDTVIAKYPDFPFGYFAKFLILKHFGDKDWKYYANKAKDIFEITTTIKGHKSEHDQALEILKRELGIN